MRLRHKPVAALSAALLAAPLLVCGPAFAAEVDLSKISLGAGLRGSFAHTDPESVSTETSDDEADDFELNSARIYISGKVTDQISVMFNTEYNTSVETLRVIDAAIQFSFSDQFNVWAGRFLPPSDRANLYGPYYANHWGVYRDGVQDGYPFETEGRADGLMYWGQFGITKVSFGAFDINSVSKGTSDVLYAGRVQLDFWDPEGGYYLNGTYYGGKDLLAVGLAAQTAAGDKAYSIDFLLEKKLASAGVVSVEAEYADYDGLGGYPSPRGTPYDKEDGYYILGAYLFPQEVGIGKFQILGKYGEATYDYVALADVDQETFEFDLNYIIKDFNARVSLYYLDVSFDPITGGGKQYGLGLQVQL